jgi:uncharacterized protein (TIGR00369 family)
MVLANNPSGLFHSIAVNPLMCATNPTQQQWCPSARTDLPSEPTGQIASPLGTRGKDVMNTELSQAIEATNGGAVRSRTVRWHQPEASQKGSTMSGLDCLLAMKSGALPKPPFADLMHFDIVSAEPGQVVFTGQPDESMYNAAGVIHGGVVGMLLDTVAGCALQTTLLAGTGYTSVEIKVNYLRTIRLSSGLLTATGTVLRAGRRIGFTEGAVTDGSGSVVATASSTLLLVDNVTRC